MQIAIVSYEFSIRAVKLVKMFPLKPLIINLNVVLKTLVFDVCGYIFIQFVYCILVKNTNINCLNNCAIVKEDF